MKRITVILLVVLGVGVRRLRRGGHTEKAHAQRESHRPLRGQRSSATATYSGDQAENEQNLIDILDNTGNPYQNLSSSTEDTDIGYQAIVRLSLSSLLRRRARPRAVRRAQVHREGGHGFRRWRWLRSGQRHAHLHGRWPDALGHRHPADRRQVRTVSARLGYLFTSSERELTSKVDGAVRLVRQRQGRFAEPGVRHRIRLAHQPGLFDPRRIPAARSARPGKSHRHRRRDGDGLGLIVRF